MGRYWRLFEQKRMWSNLCFNVILLATHYVGRWTEGSKSRRDASWSFQMPQGIVTQAVVERWLLRNGRLWVVQSSCSFGNLWFAANTAWKQTRIPVTWSSVLSPRLPCMLNKRNWLGMSHWNTTAEVTAWMFQAQNSALHSVLWLAWSLLMVPNHRWDNWGWKR